MMPEFKEICGPLRADYYCLPAIASGLMRNASRDVIQAARFMIREASNALAAADDALDPWLAICDPNDPAYDEKHAKRIGKQLNRTLRRISIYEEWLIAAEDELSGTADA